MHALNALRKQTAERKKVAAVGEKRPDSKRKKYNRSKTGASEELRARLNKRERKAAQLLAHYATCERLASALGMPAAQVDGKRISVMLWKLERMATGASTALCNGESSEATFDAVTQYIITRIGAIFGKLPPGFFVNADPRGYALKIDNEDPEARALIEAVKLHRDLGGYGILSPEIDGN